MDECFQYKGCRVILPEVEDSILEFKEIDKQMMAPFTIYADCEAIIKNVNDKDIHEISGFTIAVVSPYEKTETITFRGVDAGEVFMNKMEYLSEKLYKKIINANEKMIYTDKDKKKFQNSRECHICDKKNFLMIQQKLTTLKI